MVLMTSFVMLPVIIFVVVPLIIFVVVPDVFHFYSPFIRISRRGEEKGYGFI
jgi:hypothetical protein